MTIKLSSLKVDLAREADGDWIDYPDWPGAAFKVSSFHKPAYIIARDLLVQKLSRQNKGKMPPRGEMIGHYGKLYCDHILHDWRGFDIAYSKETALETLQDPAYRVVFDAVEWCAGQVSAVDAEFVEDAAKNSVPPSDGGSKVKSQPAG